MAFENVDYTSLDIPAAPFSDPARIPDFPKNNFVPGRMAMTCCEADMTFLGFMCKAKNARLLETKDWFKVRARVEYEYMPEYEGEGPMLYADYVEKAEPIEEIVQF